MANLDCQIRPIKKYNTLQRIKPEKTNPKEGITILSAGEIKGAK